MLAEKVIAKVEDNSYWALALKAEGISSKPLNHEGLFLAWTKNESVIFRIEDHSAVGTPFQDAEVLNAKIVVSFENKFEIVSEFVNGKLFWFYNAGFITKSAYEKHFKNWFEDNLPTYEVYFKDDLLQLKGFKSSERFDIIPSF